MKWIKGLDADEPEATGIHAYIIKLAPQPSREGNKMLKEPLKKRRHLVR
ncbi:MAG: hypothetical protein K2P19_02900 [Kineothrix sp.]|nr:hypothetical protein [Kineothrix sp.]